MLTLFLYIFSVIGIAILGIVTNAKKTNRSIVYFSLMSFSLATWLLIQFLAIKYPQSAYGLTVFGLLVFSFAPVFFLLFTTEFVGVKNTEKKAIAKLAVVLLTMMLLLSVLPNTFKSVDVVSNSLVISTGLPYSLHTFVAVLVFLLSVGVFISRFSHLDKYKKSASYFIVLGLVIALIGNIISGFVYSGKPEVQFIGPLSLLIMTMFMAYAISRHRLFDLRVTVARTAAYTISVAVFVIAFFLIGTLVTSRYIDDQNLERLVLSALLIIFVFLQQPTRKKLDRLTNKIFYRDAYEPQLFLDDLNKALVGEIEMQKLLNAVTKIMEDNLKSSYVAVGVKETEQKPLRIIGQSAPKYKENDIQYVRSELVSSGKRVIVYSDLPSDKIKLQEVFRRNDIDIIVRLLTSYDAGQEAIAYLILGPKKSGNIYNKQDIQILGIIADELVIAIQNALRFEEIQEFAVTLQQKVDEATARLRRTNEKLKELDDTKDEFISMASHQLRTPLTSVKGYLSMVLEGDAGAIKPQQKQLLEQSFLSAQRMVYIIADLLNVSRLKTGKFVLDINPTDLTDVIKGELDQLTEAFKSKKLKLNYEKPKDFPMLLLDETKTRQVIMNFIDNAIYYTPAGGKIDVSLTQDKKHIYFRVKDNGLGVPKTEQAHLFTKFYRATNARKARPDGTGLGLFMAKKVIVAQGGTILFETQEGKGSTFGFCFETAKLLPQPKK